MRKILYPLVLLSLLVALVLPFAQPVYAATYTLYPNSAGTFTNISNASAAPHWGEVDEAVADDTTSWVRQQSGVRVDYLDTYGLPNTMPTSSSISSIIVYWRGSSYYDAAGGPFPDIWGKSAVYIGGVTSYGASQLLPKDYAVVDTWAVTWADYSDTWATNPATGLAWTQSGINDLEVGVSLQAYVGGSYAIYGGCTQIYVVVNYIPPTAPTVTTSTASPIAVTSATLNGNITDDGGATITNYGFIWGTSENSTNPGNMSPVLISYADNWTAGAGTYAEGAISHSTGATLTLGTLYYFRAAACNSVGWSYGDELSFTTIGIPSISNQGASNIASTTARLNAKIVNDNGQACVASFAWAKTSDGGTNWATIIAAPSGHTDNATGTWSTGQYPYLDIGSLIVSTNYTFMARASNDAGLSYSSLTTFTTISGGGVSGVGNVSNFTASSTSTTISLVWVKGVGASNTLIRTSTSTYPTDNISGIFLYSGTGNSYLYSGLTEGTNYYFGALGLTAGVYSDNATTTMATTLAPGAQTTTLGTPATPSSWNQLPSTALISNIPFYELVNYFSNSYEIPNATMWYGLAIFFSVGLGFFVYWRGNKNVLAAILAVALGLAIGALMHLVMLWILVFFCLVAAAMAWMVGRY